MSAQTQPDPIDWPTIVRKFHDAAREFSASVARMRRTVRDRDSPEYHEACSIFRYQRRVRYERDVGLAHVRNEARRVRRELGLVEWDPPGCRWSSARSRWEVVIRPGVSKEPCGHNH